MEEAATPFPREETTPPVTKIYFGAILAARGRDFPPATCMPSSGLTYAQLSSERVRVSNQGKNRGKTACSVRFPRAKQALLQKITQTLVDALDGSEKFLDADCLANQILRGCGCGDRIAELRGPAQPFRD